MYHHDHSEGSKKNIYQLLGLKVSKRHKMIISGWGSGVLCRYVGMVGDEGVNREDRYLFSVAVGSGALCIIVRFPLLICYGCVSVSLPFQGS